jgi:hypothetical protein
MLSTFIWAVWVKMVYPQADKMIPTASTPDQPGLKKKTDPGWDEF